jgi:GST-like protein
MSNILGENIRTENSISLDMGAALGRHFANINRPIAGRRMTRRCRSGKHPLQLYSLATPNGIKVTILLEELLEAGHAAEYDAWLIEIGEGDQFGSGFVEVNPNSKIPALMDHSLKPPQRLFESGSIMLYLAEKFGGAFMPEGSVGPDRDVELAVLADGQRALRAAASGISTPMRR